MTKYRIPTTELMSNDSGKDIKVLTVQTPTNGETLLGRVKLIDTTVYYYSPPSTDDAPITADHFGYTIEDRYGQKAKANVKVIFPADIPAPPVDTGCRFYIEMERGVGRANNVADNYSPEYTNGFVGWKAGQVVMTTICTTGTNGAFLMPWTQIASVYSPQAASTVRMYYHLVTAEEAEDWNVNGFQIVTPWTGDESYFFGTISGNMRVFNICDIDPKTVVVEASCDYYPNGSTYTPEKSLGPIFYGSDLYFFNPTKYTSGRPPASPIVVEPYMGIYTSQYNALQYTQLGFVEGDQTVAQPLGYGFTVTESAGFVVARYVLRSTYKSAY